MTGRMNGYFALLRLQLLSRLADYRPRNLFRPTPKAAEHTSEAPARKGLFSRQKGQGLSKGQFFLYIFLFIYLTGFLVVTENLILDTLLEMQPFPLPDLLLTMAVVMAMLCTLIMSFFFIMSSLYFSRDAAFIASLPVKPRTVLAAKLTQVWLSETAISAVFILPASILVYIRAGDILNLDALFFLRLLAVWGTVAILPIVIVSFLSSVLIRFSSLWKHREIIATVGGIALMVVYFIFCFGMGNITGSAGDDGQMKLDVVLSITNRVESMSRYFPPAGWAVKGLIGDWAYLALFAAVSLAAAALTVWLLGYVYRKLSLLQTETPTASRKVRSKGESYISGTAFSASVKREIRQILRVPAYATNTLPSAFMPLLMTGMMAFTFNKTLSQSELPMGQILAGLGGGIVVAILSAVLTFMAGINPALATAVTREGRGHEFLTALPVPPRIYVKAKLAVGYGLSALGCIASAVLMMALLPDFALHIAIALVIAMLFSYACGCITLSRDVRHPKLNWLTEQEAIKQSMGALMGMLISWGILSLLAVLSYFLLRWGADMTVYAAVIIALLAALAFFSRQMLYKTADKYYCQG